MKLKWIEDEINSKSLDDFLGLSPSRMEKILYSSLVEIEGVVSFNASFDKCLLDDVLVVKKAVLLLQFIAEAGEAKATKNGYLPKKIVNILHNLDSSKNYTIQSEEYDLDVLALRYAVTKCGWLKLKSGKFSLTKKGNLVIENTFAPKDYLILLEYWMKNYNWQFTDGYSACPIVQQAAVFLLFLLHKKSGGSISAEEVTKLFIRAFPYSINEVSSESLRFDQSPEEVF